MSNTWWKDSQELKKEQSDILDIDPDKSLLINGPPGSGKTNLLLLRANQLASGDHPNLHIVVFGSLLKNFIHLGGAQYKFPPEKIVTDTRLLTEILRSEGADFDTQGMDLMQARRARADRLDSLIMSQNIGKIYDAILLDEAQDYSPQEIRIFDSLCDVLVATSDKRQKIYEVEDCTGELNSRLEVHHSLKHHFRNGLEICRIADGINKGKADYVPMCGTSNYDERSYPSKVVTRSGLTIKQQGALIAERLLVEIFTYPEDIIGVLCPTNADLDAIEAELNRSNLADKITRANGRAFDSSRPVWLSTLASAKGLEFRTVHIAGLDSLTKTGPAQRRLIFTGVTRAKTTLSMYWENSIPGYLESAIRTATPARSPVTIDTIFGKA